MCRPRSEAVPKFGRTQVGLHAAVAASWDAARWIIVIVKIVLFALRTLLLRGVLRLQQPHGWTAPEEVMHALLGILFNGVSLASCQGLFDIMAAAFTTLPALHGLKQTHVKGDGFRGWWLELPPRLGNVSLPSSQGPPRRLVIMYLHGGGFQVGHPLMYNRAWRDILSGLRDAHVEARVFSVDYPLSGEARYPAALLSSVAAYRWLASQGFEVVLGGDSAGGNLALVTLLALRDGHPAMDGHPVMADCSEACADAAATSRGIRSDSRAGRSRATAAAAAAAAAACTDTTLDSSPHSAGRRGTNDAAHNDFAAVDVDAAAGAHCATGASGIADVAGMRRACDKRSSVAVHHGCGPTSGPTSRPTSGPTSRSTSSPTHGPSKSLTSGPTSSATINGWHAGHSVPAEGKKGAANGHTAAAGNCNKNISPHGSGTSAAQTNSRFETRGLPCRRPAVRRPLAALLISPWADLSMNSATYSPAWIAKQSHDFLLVPELIHMARQYLGPPASTSGSASGDGSCEAEADRCDERLLDPFVSPVRAADFSGLVRNQVMIVAGGMEVLLPDIRALAERMARDVAVVYHEEPTMLHCCCLLQPFNIRGQEPLVEFLVKCCDR